MVAGWGVGGGNEGKKDAVPLNPLEVSSAGWS